MTAHKKARTSGGPGAGFVSSTCVLGAIKRMINPSKRSADALISQSYTKTIRSGKSIDSDHALISPKHCEISVFGSLTFKKDQNLFNQEWTTDRPLSATTCIALNGDVWERRVPSYPVCGMQGKWGRFTQNNHGRQEWTTN